MMSHSTIHCSNATSNGSNKHQSERYFYIQIKHRLEFYRNLTLMILCPADQQKKFPTL